MAKWVGLGPKEVITRQHFVYFQPDIDCVHGARMNTLYIICKLLYSLGQGTDYAGHPDERLLTDSYKMQVWGEGKGLQTV